MVSLLLNDISDSHGYPEAPAVDTAFNKINDLNGYLPSYCKFQKSPWTLFVFTLQHLCNVDK